MTVLILGQYYILYTYYILTAPLKLKKPRKKLCALE